MKKTMHCKRYKNKTKASDIKTLDNWKGAKMKKIIYFHS